MEVLNRGRMYFSILTQAEEENRRILHCLEEERAQLKNELQHRENNWQLFCIKLNQEKENLKRAQKSYAKMCKSRAKLNRKLCEKNNIRKQLNSELQQLCCCLYQMCNNLNLKRATVYEKKTELRNIHQCDPIHDLKDILNNLCFQIEISCDEVCVTKSRVRHAFQELKYLACQLVSDKEDIMKFCQCKDFVCPGTRKPANAIVQPCPQDKPCKKKVVTIPCEQQILNMCRNFGTNILTDSKVLECLKMKPNVCTQRNKKVCTQGNKKVCTQGKNKICTQGNNKICTCNGVVPPCDNKVPECTQTNVCTQANVCMQGKSNICSYKEEVPPCDKCATEIGTICVPRCTSICEKGDSSIFKVKPCDQEPCNKNEEVKICSEKTTETESSTESKITQGTSTYSRSTRTTSCSMHGPHKMVQEDYYCKEVISDDETPSISEKFKHFCSEARPPLHVNCSHHHTHEPSTVSHSHAECHHTPPIKNSHQMACSDEIVYDTNSNSASKRPMRTSYSSDSNKRHHHHLQPHKTQHLPMPNRSRLSDIQTSNLVVNNSKQSTNPSESLAPSNSKMILKSDASQRSTAGQTNKKTIQDPPSKSTENMSSQKSVTMATETKSETKSDTETSGSNQSESSNQSSSRTVKSNHTSSASTELLPLDKKKSSE